MGPAVGTVRTATRSARRAASAGAPAARAERVAETGPGGTGTVAPAVLPIAVPAIEDPAPSAPDSRRHRASSGSSLTWGARTDCGRRTW